MRQRRRPARVIVGSECQHAAMRGRARRIAVLEHVAAAINPRAFAVPHREHTIVFRAREQIGLLGAPDHRRAEVLVDARREFDCRSLEMLLGLPQLQVEAAQRTAAISRNEAARVEPRRAIAQLLHQRQSHQRLHPGQKNPAALARVFVVEVVVTVQDWRERGGHRKPRASNCCRRTAAGGASRRNHNRATSDFPRRQLSADGTSS
jgi:hypothetical protein